MKSSEILVWISLIGFYFLSRKDEPSSAISACGLVSTAGIRGYSTFFESLQVGIWD